MNFSPAEQQSELKDAVDSKKRRSSTGGKDVPSNPSTSKENTQRSTRAQQSKFKSPRRSLLEKSTQQKLRTAGDAKPTQSKQKQFATSTSGLGVWRDTKHSHKTAVSHSCPCADKLSVCTVCTGRIVQHAARAGTPGFRAPEVLLKHTNQTTGAWLVFLPLSSC